MENDERVRSFRTPLLEIVIVVGIFSILSILLVKLFLSADQLEAASENISKAVLKAESTAEVIKRSDSEGEAIEALGLGKEQNSNSYILSFDKHWNIVLSGGAYTLRINFSTENKETGSLLTADLTITDLRGEELCFLPVKHYVPKEN